MSGDETPAKTRAVALQYDHPGVPVVTAKGEGAFARRIIEEHRGSIQIESRQEKGTCFVISLPLNPEGGL